MCGHLYLACINVMEKGKKYNSWTKCIFMLPSPCQIKYSGWKFRVEAHSGKKNQIEFAFIIKGFLCIWRDHQFWFGGREYSYFAKLLQNSKQLGYNSCFWPEAPFCHFFFSIFNFETVKIEWKNTSSTQK